MLRPFFLTAADETRIRTASETIADIGERVVAAAMADARLLAALGVTEAEARLIGIDPGYARASTASRLDAFLLPDSLHFAEYNAESPAGPAYTQRLCELFDALEPMTALRRDFAVTYHRTIPPLLAALLDSYRDWGGTASPPTVAIVDFRGVPTWTEFELLQDAFVEAGVPTVVCDPRELTFEGGVLRAEGRRIDLVYRRVLLNDILARPDDCASLVAAYEQRAVCVANTFPLQAAAQEGVLRGADRSRVRVADERRRARDRAGARAVDAAGRRREDGPWRHHDAAPRGRAPRPGSARPEAERRIRRHRRDARMGSVGGRLGRRPAARTGRSPGHVGSPGAHPRDAGRCSRISTSRAA